MDAAVELEALRADNARLNELLAVKDQLTITHLTGSKAELLACKDELLASRTAELQRCQELLKGKAVSVVGHASSSKRQRSQDSSSTAESPLDRDDILDYVFSFVGGGDHLYIGGVSRNWRGRYLRHCVQTSKSELDGKLVTRHRSVVTTESRLQLALNCGLTLEDWRFDNVFKARLIYIHSLEPEKVVTLLRVHDVPWSTKLCHGAARYNKLVLLQWLHSHSCPWDERNVLQYASRHGSLAMLEWLLITTPSWSADFKKVMLAEAGCRNELAVVKWLRARGADWPRTFTMTRKCWNVPAVQWALSFGSGWLTWQCEHCTADNYEDAHFKQQATALLEWAHANGCPCTCGHVQQQQQ
jgi:hypothetical protein